MLVKIHKDTIAEEEYNAIELGEKVRVSDPCYDEDTWCAGTLTDVLPGQYICKKYIMRTNKRIAAIEVSHIKHQSKYTFDEDAEIDVGVDSGQCGIFELEYFLEHQGQETWYEKVCQLTGLQLPDANSIDGQGYVSSSGYGDGSYDCNIARNADGKIIAIRVIYIADADIYRS